MGSRWAVRSSPPDSGSPMAIYSNFMRKIGPDGALPAVFGASVDFGWAALVRGVDFRWVRPSGHAGLAAAWQAGCRFCARAALAIPALRSVICPPGVRRPIRECADADH